ncbi:MAG: hypothetical protein CMA02_02825 [Euryarchaeota archaeon]|nr:hypothetical protein [Euryarchaeota archaeon]|tara:strand:- start:100 stop:417 length:318 start_codon:yes stop_codon:yes gene_type:complete
MNLGIVSLAFCLLILHLGIGIIAWFEKRYLPLLQKITDKETLNMKLNRLASKYQSLGIDVPQGLIECPSLLVREAKRMEIRLSIEIALISLAGTIPPGLLVIIFG